MRSESPALALVSAAAVTEDAHGNRLSRREATHLSGLAHPRVRRRWLAGRLAAKSLLLGGQVAERLVTLDGESLRALPAARCREIELLPAAGGAPRPTRHGRELPARVSISHCGGISCATVAGLNAAAGIDLEAVAPRVAAFYRGNFTLRERQWAEAGASSTGLSADWLFTFLWTVKEAALKAGVTEVRSVWELTGLEIDLPAELPRLLAATRQASLGECFARFETVLCAARTQARARIETTSTPDFVLSLLTAVEASR